MLVADLIEALQRLPRDAYVYGHNSDGYYEIADVYIDDSDDVILCEAKQ